MPQDYFNLNCRAALLAAIAAAYPVIGYTAPAAQVDFAVGNVTAVGANGQSRALGKGAQVEQGDTVNTNSGRAQLRFTDGAYVSLQPESQFRIDKYRYEGKQDGNEQGFFSLLKGGLRTITGLVGRTNKANYQVSTSVATIGIRGTEYTIQYGQSITGAVGEGQIEVCNGGGCLSVTNGESYYVQGQEFKPVLTNKRTDLPAPPPEAPPQAFKQNETVVNSGDPCALFPAQCGLEALPPAPPALLTGTVEANVGVIGGRAFNVYAPTTATLDIGGVLTHFDDSTRTVVLEGPITDAGNDGIVAWGRASGATGGESGFFNSGEMLHYIVGTPADISALGGLQATYTLSGATRPTSLNTGDVAGTLDKMSMTADFLASGKANVSGSMAWTLLNKPLSAIFVGGTGNGPGFSASGPTNVSGTVDLTGFFAGTKASRAGVVYTVFDSSIDSEDAFIGAAALTQTSLGKPAPLTGTITPAYVGVTGSAVRAVYNSTPTKNFSATFDGSGLLTQFDDPTRAVFVQGPIDTMLPLGATVPVSGNDGIIAWGRASGATGGESPNFSSGDPLHFVVSAVSDISQLGGMRGTYTLLGATTLTGAGTGLLTSMSMTADFQGSAGASVTGAMAWTLQGSQQLSATFSGGMSGAQFFASGPTSFSGSVNLNGFFAGANASRAGVVYSVQDSSIASGTFLGSAALTQIGLVSTSSQSSRSTRF